MTRTPEARLWHAVLAHGLHDVAKGRDAGWLGSRDFAIVCALARLDPEALLSRFDPERFCALINAATDAGFRFSLRARRTFRRLESVHGRGGIAGHWHVI